MGDDISEARDSVLAERYGWKITTNEEPSDDPVGTVLKQSIPEGRVLAQGMSINLTVAKKRPKQWTTIFEQSGAGSTRTDEFRVPAGKVRINYSFTGNTNAILSLETPGDEYGGELLLNEIGDYSDSTRVYDQEGVRYLEISGGQWSVEVQAFE